VTLPSHIAVNVGRTDRRRSRLTLPSPLSRSTRPPAPEHAHSPGRCRLLNARCSPTTRAPGTPEQPATAPTPRGADQPLNAERCASLGVARVLDAVRATPADGGAAVTAILGDPSYREAALCMRDEIVRLPRPEHAVDLLRALAMRYPRRVGSSEASPRGWTVRST
jgi:hypothetical protein